MSAYLRVARVLCVLAVLLIGLLLAMPMDWLGEHQRVLTLAFAAGLLFAAVISFCTGSIYVQEEDHEDSKRG